MRFLILALAACLLAAGCQTPVNPEQPAAKPQPAPIEKPDCGPGG